jgi:TonB family protein
MRWVGVAAMVLVSLALCTPPHVGTAGGAPGAAPGGTDNACVRSVIDRESGRIGRYFEECLKRTPSLKGSLNVKFTVTISGATENVTIVSSTTGEPTFDADVIAYVKKWRFGSCHPSAAMDLEVPFAFEGRNDGPQFPLPIEDSR